MGVDRAYSKVGLITFAVYQKAKRQNGATARLFKNNTVVGMPWRE